jgi:DNA topoisomerase-1
MLLFEAESEAESAGLRHVTDLAPGITRSPLGRDWTYRLPDGTEITDEAERGRIHAIGIPPAWTDVWISPDPAGHIQATGRDARNRKQYRYHPRWREVRDGTKFHRVGTVGRGLPGLRRRTDTDLGRPGLPKDKVLAAVLRLMDETLIRVGNEEYARQNDSYGLTTLRQDQVAEDGTATMRFDFRAKSGKHQEVRLRDPRLAEVVHACHELPGQELFQYLDDDGRVVNIGSADVNAYLRTLTGSTFTAKDFRTWGGSVTAAETLVRLGPPTSAADAKHKVNAAIDAAAARLNNTRTVARTSYIDPRVLSAYPDGRLHEAFTEVSAKPRLKHAEAALLLIL